MFERRQLVKLKNRIKEPRKFIQVILGPRQSGKTTLVEQLTQKLKVHFTFVSTDAVPPSNSMWIEQQWEAARIKLNSSSSKQHLLVIDEIQKIENWSEVVKKNWDSDTRNKVNLKVILLGSSTITIQSGLTESLMGRFEAIHMPHWSFNEMHQAFQFTPEEYVYFGGYPGAADLIGDEKRWLSYIRDSIIETTISKDILQMATVLKPALLKNLFELSCKYSSEILSYTKILGQLHDAGNTTTLAHYQNLLDQSWMISGLQKFSLSGSSVRSSIPKWLVYNSALVSAYSDLNFQESRLNRGQWGRRVEQIIGAYLLNESRVSDFNLYYWRKGNDEVDFIIMKNKKIISIEVKTSRVKFHKGIEKFSREYDTHKNILISEEGLSWREFLEINIDSLFN